MNDAAIEFLIEEAEKALEAAYCPYSKYAVGAAVMCADGKVYKGCNIENSSFSLTICAERVAIAKAVSDGKYDIEAIAIFHDGLELPYPCGACLQVLSEFNKDAEIIVASDTGVRKYKVSDLLPKGFSLESE